ncbi:MAG: 50S ribosomal protein L24 [Defluviicoccus sp.]|nr:50S ribosomal protein L24 [Defluviicoccus sp.]MDE0383800.1 50S ribosomal protein L24 [Defluviicoccus sp.]
MGRRANKGGGIKRIRKGDNVIVLTGRDKGKRGSVLKSMPKEGRLIVQGVNVVKRHTRPSQTQSGGIVEKEAPIHVSNVALLDPASDRPTRVGVRLLEDGRKVRYAKASGELID